MASETPLSAEEIVKHNSPGDCWIVVENKVWDMTNFAPNHPGGGEIIYKYAGHDATAAYSSVHSRSLLSNNLPPSALKGTVDRRTVTDEWSRPPPASKTEVKLSDRPPLHTIINAQDFEDVAKRTATKKTWAFYSSAATDCITRNRNREFFNQIWFRPRLLRPVGKISTKTKILGKEVGLPIFVSPAAMVKMIHPDGEKAIAKGCLDECVPQCISTNASFSAEEILASVPGKANRQHPFWFQLYVNKDRAQSEKLLRHIAGLGIDTIFVTVDGPVQGKREADERVKADESLSTPMSGQKAKNDRRGGGIGRIMGNYIDPNFAWEDFTWLRQHWPGKIVVKGVQCWQDAVKCKEMGLDGVLLSNHGGRNLDTSPPALLVLLELHIHCPEIFDAPPLEPNFEILVDGGIRRGTDVLKCLCLGATGVGMGRPFLYAANYGAEGVQHWIDIIKQELEIAMALIGVTELNQCQGEFVNTAELDPLVRSSGGHPFVRKQKRAAAKL